MLFYNKGVEQGGSNLYRVLAGFIRKEAAFPSKEGFFMNTVEMLRQFYDYNLWANGRVFQALKESNDEKAVRYFAHILTAEKTWLLRLQTNLDTTGFNFWKDESIEICEKLLNENKESFDAFFSDLTEEKLEKTATYKNSKGVEFTNTYREIFTHVFFHSAYHRGQIATALRLNDITPPYTDFIGFLREKK